MKNIIKSTLLVLCSVGLLTACSDDNDHNPVLQLPTTFHLNTPAYSQTDIDLATSTGIHFTWSQPDYGLPVAAEYQLEVSPTGDFDGPELSEVEEGQETSATHAVLDTYYSVPEGDMLANKLSDAINKIMGWSEENPAPDVQTVYVRAIASTKGAEPIYSNAVTINVIPSLVFVPSYAHEIYEIGNESGWGTAYKMVSFNDDGIYRSYNWLDGGFKFRPNEGNWDGDFGQDPNGAYGDLVTDGEEDCNKADGAFPDNAKPAGFYQINVDMTTMTWNIVEVTNISMIGGFNGWGDDVDLTWDADEKCWVGEVTFEQDTEFKFRMNHDWSCSFGTATGNRSDYSSLSEFTSDNNLTAEAGTYSVKLWLSTDGEHKAELTKK